MTDSQSAWDWGRAWPSGPRTQVAAFAGWQRQDRGRRPAQCARRVIQVGGDWESVIQVSEPVYPRPGTVPPMPPAVRRWLTPAAWVAGVSAVLLLVFPLGFPNY